MLIQKYRGYAGDGRIVVSIREILFLFFLGGEGGGVGGGGWGGGGWGVGVGFLGFFFFF